MEVGAVKQAFNNEVILLKKKLTQAKIQVIHKLTRKAKTFAEKKAPEKLKEKLKRKAESAVNEVLIIKKIKARDIAKFTVTHKGELKDYLNRPKVDNDKACARLLLHKALQDKYKLIRGRFSNVPIQDLFMSRLERRKLKKEAKEKQKNKKKGKDAKVINSEGDWNVEDVKMDDSKDVSDGDEQNDVSEDENDESDVESQFNDDVSENNNNGSESDESVQEVYKNIVSDEDNEKANEEENIEDASDNDNEIEKPPTVKKALVDNTKIKKSETKLEITTKNTEYKAKEVPKPKEIKKKPEKKQKDVNKNKNLSEKILARKFKKESDTPVIESKIVDPFFITSTGENYMSIVEPRQPDEVKEIHKQGNRKLRRAAMFGHVPKIKPKYDHRQEFNTNRFNSENGYEKRNNFKNKINNDRNEIREDRKGNFNTRNDRFKVEKEEKLHPSWEAKKKKSGILPFEGKKIVFDDS